MTKPGARIKALRRELSLTLDALAEHSGVSRAMISLIERDESAPSAVVLERIAAALGVPLANLFDASPADNPIARAAERTTWTDPDSGYERRNISPAFPSPLRIVEVTLPPGARVAYETGARAAPVHQQVWVQEGTLELVHGKTRHTLGAGDCLAMQLDARTAFANRTTAPVRYVVVVATLRARAPRS